MNHSCNPNCIVIPVIVEGEYHLTISSLRDIQRGERLTYSYGWSSEEGKYDLTECTCGSDECIGYIESDEWTRLMISERDRKSKG